jgi:hypothetical protein
MKAPGKGENSLKSLKYFKTVFCLHISNFRSPSDAVMSFLDQYLIAPIGTLFNLAVALVRCTV